MIFTVKLKAINIVSPAIATGWHTLFAQLYWTRGTGLQGPENQLTKPVRRVGCFTDVSSYQEVLNKSESCYHMHIDSDSHDIEYV